jgi:hypothetical protein
MGPSHVMRTDPCGVVVNIEAELDFWRQCFRKWPFHRRGLSFDTYVPTLKFGYDCYLLYHHHELDALLPALKERYAYRLPPTQRLDWPRGESIIREAWRRMQGAPGDDPAAAHQAALHCVVSEHAYRLPTG